SSSATLAGTPGTRKVRVKANPRREPSMPASYANHRAQIKAILLGWGMPEENAETTSEILSWADLHGVDSHGISMIPGYDGLRRSGRAEMGVRARGGGGRPGVRG